MRQRLRDKSLPWEKPGLIQLTNYTDLFDQIYLPGVDLLSPKWRVVLRSIESFQHLIVHREAVDIDTVQSIMKFPRMLRDEIRSQLIERVYQIFFEEPAESVSQEDLRDAENLIYRPRELRFAADLLGRIQDSLELSCWLNWRRFAVPEEVELQVYQEMWSPKHNDGLDRDTLRQTRNLRNVATHRADLDKWDTMEFVKDAIIFTNLLGNTYQALEIEILAQQWFTSKPRGDVLTYLCENIFDNCHTSADFETEHGKKTATRERRRRFAVARALMQSSTFTEMRSKGKLPAPARPESHYVREQFDPPIIILERYIPTRPLILRENPTDGFEVPDADNPDAEDFRVRTVQATKNSFAHRKEPDWEEEHKRMV